MDERVCYRVGDLGAVSGFRVGIRVRVVAIIGR